VISCKPFVYRGLREAARRFLKGKKGNLCHLFVSPSKKRPLLWWKSRTRIGNSRAKIDQAKRRRTDAEGPGRNSTIAPPCAQRHPPVLKSWPSLGHDTETRFSVGNDISSEPDALSPIGNLFCSI